MGSPSDWRRALAVVATLLLRSVRAAEDATEAPRERERTGGDAAAGLGGGRAGFSKASKVSVAFGAVGFAITLAFGFALAFGAGCGIAGSSLARFASRTLAFSACAADRAAAA